MATNSKNLRYRPVTVESTTVMVPSGIARNNRNKSWQVKVEKNGVVMLKGNYTDATYGDYHESLFAAKKALTAKLESVEIAAEQQEKSCRTESVQLTVRSSLLWRVTPKKTTLQINVYDKAIKKNRIVYVGTSNTLVSKRDLVIGKIALAMTMDALLEDGENLSLVDTGELLIWPEFEDKAASVYEEHVLTSPHVAALVGSEEGEEGEEEEIDFDEDLFLD